MVLGLGFFKRGSYSRANRFEVLRYLEVAKPENAHATHSNRRRALIVVALRPIRVMTIAVELDDQPVAGAVKVGDVLAERFLARELPRKIAQELEPQLLFRGRGIAAQSLGAPS